VKDGQADALGGALSACSCLLPSYKTQRGTCSGLRFKAAFSLLLSRRGFFSHYAAYTNSVFVHGTVVRRFSSKPPRLAVERKQAFTTAGMRGCSVAGEMAETATRTPCRTRQNISCSAFAAFFFALFIVCLHLAYAGRHTHLCLHWRWVGAQRCLQNSGAWGGALKEGRLRTITRVTAVRLRRRRQDGCGAERKAGRTAFGSISSLPPTRWHLARSSPLLSFSSSCCSLLPLYNISISASYFLLCDAACLKLGCRTERAAATQAGKWRSPLLFARFLYL